MIEYDNALPEDDEDFTDDGTADLEDEDSPLKSPEEIQARVRRLDALRTRRDATKKAADDAKKEFDIFQAEFFAEYERSPFKKSMTIDLGDDRTVQITPVRTHFGRILNRDDALAYFESRATIKEYMKEDFRMGRLHELVRECIEQKKPLPPGVDFYTKEYFRITEKD